MLTVAHRINTVVDADRIAVVDGGRIREIGDPYMLLRDPASALSQLVSSEEEEEEEEGEEGGGGGRRRREELLASARRAYLHREVGEADW